MGCLLVVCLKVVRQMTEDRRNAEISIKMNKKAFLIPFFLFIVGIILMMFPFFSVEIRIVGGIIALASVLSSLVMVLLAATLLTLKGSISEIEKKDKNY